MDESSRRPRQVDGDGAAKRRRLRRLRSWWRHEQQTVAAVLATYQHHSAPRGPRTARTGEGARDELHGYAPEDAPSQAAGTQYFPMDVDDLPAAGGSRPDRLSEVRPQEWVQRRTVEQIILAPMLDVPVPLMEEKLLVDAFAPLDVRVPEQVIEVPMIFIDELSVRTPVREPHISLGARPCALSSWRNSWWKCLRSSPFPRCSGLWSRTWTFQFRVVVCGIFKVFPQDRLQRCLLSLWNAFLSGMWSRSLVFLVEAFEIFFQDKVHPLLLTIQLVLLMLWMRLVMGFSHFSPRKKSAECRAGQCGPAPARQLMDTASL